MLQKQILMTLFAIYHSILIYKLVIFVMFTGLIYSVVQSFILESIPLNDFLQSLSRLLCLLEKLFEDSPPKLTKHI